MHEFPKIRWPVLILMSSPAAVVLILFGLAVWGITLAAVMLACPAVIFLGLKKISGRPLRLPSEPAPRTEGMLLEWLAPVYDWCCPNIGIGRALRDATLRYAALKPGERVLDVGCGTGVLTRLAAESVGSAGMVIGIDPGPKMIGIARENAAVDESGGGSRTEFRLAAIENLPFEDGSFDCVLSSFMIHHLPPDVKLKGLKEVWRVLKPGGRVLAVDIGRPSNPLWWALVWPLRLWSFTKDHIAGRLGGYFLRAGFDRVETLEQWKGILSFYKAYKG